MDIFAEQSQKNLYKIVKLSWFFIFWHLPFRDFIVCLYAKYLRRYRSKYYKQVKETNLEPGFPYFDEDLFKRIDKK